MSRRVTKRLVRVGRRLLLAVVLVAFGTMAFVYLRWVYREQRFNRMIEEVAAAQGADKFLIKAVMRQESGFDPFARSSAGAMGLMQVMGPAGEDWALGTGRQNFRRDMLWDSRANIEAGTWYLQRALRRWQSKDDPLPFALAEYNAGLGNVQKWLPRGRETTAAEFQAAIAWPGVRKYIEKVTTYHADYRERGRL